MDATATDYYHSPDESLDHLVPYFNENDISWMIGVSYRFNKRLGITGRYTRGITPLLDPEKHDLAVASLHSYFLPSGQNIIFRNDKDEISNLSILI
jgi:hypothetical protein